MKKYLITSLKAGLFAVVLAFSNLALSQNGAFSTISFSMVDSATSGSSDNVTVVVKNVDPVMYAGYINIYYTTDTVAFSPLLLCSLNNVSLNSGDTISTSCTINFDSAYFQVGNRIVVVWSSGNGKMAADSLVDSIKILPYTAGIHEHDAALSFSILPSLTHDFIQIHVNQPSLFKNKLQTLYITDVLGRPVYTEPFNGDAERRIPVDHLPPGLYFLELRYENKVSATQKFVRTN